MVKIRLKRLGYKKNPVYRIVVLNSTTKRQAAPIQQLGFYNPKTKEMKLDKVAALDWISKGAQPTERLQKMFATLGLCAAPALREQPKKSAPKAKAVARMQEKEEKA